MYTTKKLNENNRRNIILETQINLSRDDICKHITSIERMLASKFSLETENCPFFDGIASKKYKIEKGNLSYHIINMKKGWKLVYVVRSSQEVISNQITDIIISTYDKIGGYESSQFKSKF